MGCMCIRLRGIGGICRCRSWLGRGWGMGGMIMCELNRALFVRCLRKSLGGEAYMGWEKWIRVGRGVMGVFRMANEIAIDT